MDSPAHRSSTRTETVEPSSVDTGAVEAVTSDLHGMRLALAEARAAQAAREVPVGAVVVQDGIVMGSGSNATEMSQDPTAHAEMVAIQQAAARAGSRRLTGAILYVTLEPCAMCAGAIVLARLSRLVFGVFDPKTGACGSLRNLVQDPRLNHSCEVAAGVMEQECGELLRGFFSDLRRATDKQSDDCKQSLTASGRRPQAVVPQAAGQPQRDD